MPSAPQPEKNLERLLRSLPERQAPASLEKRVMLEIARRAALPWWRRSFANWPFAARSGFFALAALAAVMLVAGIFRLQGVPFAPFSALSADWSRWSALARVVAGAGREIAASIPSYWLYGALALLATCYATVIGVSAAAYRTFTARSA